MDADRTDTVDVHLATAARPLVLTLVPSLGVLIVGLATGWHWAVATLIAALLLASVIFQFLIVRSKNRAGPVMTLDSVGLTVRGHPLVPWGDIDHIEVQDLGRGRNWFMRFATRHYGKVVAFIPRPGVDLPSPPGGRTDNVQWADYRQQHYGTNLTVVASLMSVSAPQLIAAAQRLGNLPVQPN